MNILQKILSLTVKNCGTLKDVKIDLIIRHNSWYRLITMSAINQEITIQS